MSVCYTTSSSFYKHHIPTYSKPKPISISTRTIKPIIATKCKPSDDANDIHELLKILPHDLRDNLVVESKRDQLLEVILDLGRLPEARYLGDSGRRYLRDTEVSMEELEYAENAIGEIGGDNRAGITGTLHRISAVRNRKGVVVGLTCRVGRAVRGHIDMVRDLLQFGESILFIGRPGVGKTTVMREISRVLSDELQKRVVVVDTSNEIGGGGDIPHPAIGSTRRMQVSKPFMQHKVMIEAVENHMPEVIIIDEISTRDEVNACKSIAERGVMLIGSAHGDRLENIIKNPVLSRLAGGVETVTLGDEEARKRNTRKSVSQRSGPSTFPFMIEMRDRHYWVVHKVFYVCLRARDTYTSSKIFNFLF
ncbi:putative AAA+ ATPase domain, ATPase, AAA-type, core [Helianthus anomalus]